VHIFGKDDVVAIVQGAEEIGRRKDHEAMLAQLEIAHHLRMQEAHDVGEHRKGEAGDHFLRHRGPAQDVAALEHKRPQPGLREIRAAGQAVVAAAHDGHVVDLRHRRRPRSPGRWPLPRQAGCAARLAIARCDLERMRTLRTAGTPSAGRSRACPDSCRARSAPSAGRAPPAAPARLKLSWRSADQEQIDASCSVAAIAPSYDFA
jgi:hypothetical protein